MLISFSKEWKKNVGPEFVYEDAFVGNLLCEPMCCKIWYNLNKTGFDLNAFCMYST